MQLHVWRHPDAPRFCQRGEGPHSSHVYQSQTNNARSVYDRFMRSPRQFFVYIMSNGPRSATHYTGITGNLAHRVWQHKNHLVTGFTSRYNLTRLVYYEMFFHPALAIAREKEIKGWRREKKLKLIQAMNPQWNDLAAGWEERYKPDGCEIPRPAGNSAGLRDDGF